MDPDEGGLDNIFEEYESRENDGESNGMGINEESNNETSTGVRVQPTKRIVKNPRLKFNPERLCGERGIPVLVDHFKNVKFKGKGHEKEDLDKLLTKLEHWTHRLFPSIKFNECLYHIEKLGKKRPVQTCIRKIRLDMPILGSDFVKDDDDEEDDIQRNEDLDSVEIDAFDKLVGENQNFNPHSTLGSEVDSGFSMFSSPSQTVPTSVLGGQVLGSTGSNLTEEQKERLERNRMLAIERRKARLASVQHNATESVPENERTSQEDPIPVPLDSPKRSKIIPDMLASSSCSQNNENNKSSKLNNQNSDNLGLDDLIALVDSEEVSSDKIVNLFSEQSTKIYIETSEKLPQSNMLSNFKETISCNKVDNSTTTMTTTSNMLGSTEDKNLELDSLMGLINDNSEEYRQDSNLLETAKHDSHTKNLISGEEMTTSMDCEGEILSEKYSLDSSSLVIDEDPSM